MREHALDEFESLFERASIPVFDLPELALVNITVVVKGDALDHTVLELANCLVARFGSAVSVRWPAGLSAERAASIERKHDLHAAGQSYDSPTDLARQLNDEQCHLLLLPQCDADEASGTELDALVKAADAPVLIVRTPLERPREIFGSVLHSLTSSLQQINNLAYSFLLVADKGSLVLLHTIDESEIDEVRETLKVSPEISPEGGETLLNNLMQHAERYLKGMVAASRDEPYDVTYRLAVGEALDVVQHELREGEYRLLVVGSHEHGRSDIEAAAYQLMHLIREIPVLAL